MNRRLVPLAILAIAIALVVICAAPARAAAQDPTDARPSRPADSRARRFHLGIAAGPSLPTGVSYGVNELGLHAQISAMRPGRGRTGARIDLLAQGFATVEAIPGCVQGSRCERWTPYPSQVYSATASALIRPVVGSDWLHAMAGAGAYVGLDSHGDHFGTRAGVAVGIGVTPFRGRGPALALELRYHHLLASLGTMRGMLLPSLAVYF